MKRAAVLALAFALSLPVPAHAAAPVLVNTTAYTEGTVCCRGVKAREGIVAGRPEWYGSACVIYRAVPDGGSYRMGSAIGIYEVLDTGYGRSTRDGIPSRVRADKTSRGTIEVGQCIDRYSESYESAVDWMRETGGKCYIQIIKGVEG